MPSVGTEEAKRHEKRIMKQMRGAGGAGKFGTVMKWIAKIGGTVASLASVLNVELKTNSRYHNLSPDSSGTSASGPLIQIANGTEDNQRIGNSIRMQRIILKGDVLINSEATVLTTRVRVMLVKDRQANGESIDITDVLQSVDVNAFWNPDLHKRFQVLMDKTYNLDKSNNSQATVFYNRKHRFHTNYNGTTTSPADIECNSVWLLAISDQATYEPTLQCRSQVQYVDN